MRKRIFIGVLAALFLVGIGVVVWTVAGLPPVRMVWRYGFDYGPEPTGQVKPVEGIAFVGIPRREASFCICRATFYGGCSPRRSLCRILMRIAWR